MTVGRKPVLPTERKSNQFLFIVPENQKELMDKMFLIAKREGVTMTEIYLQAFKEYNEKHGAGNFQTMLSSYEKGGVKSEAQFEVLIFEHFKDAYEVKYVDIIYYLMEQGMKSKKRVDVAGRVFKRLKEAGVRVFR